MRKNSLRLPLIFPRPIVTPHVCGTPMPYNPSFAQKWKPMSFVNSYSQSKIIKKNKSSPPPPSSEDDEIEAKIKDIEAKLKEEDLAEVREAEVNVTTEPSEKVIGAKSTHEFQAHTKKILDIVARSLYSDKEIFLRELVSNSSDALEKLRHIQLQKQETIEPELDLYISIRTDPENKTLIIQDTGIGMSKEDLINNLGIIARSGSEEFLANLGEDKKSQDIIGQFGVGFYSVFMVADKVEVFSRSALPGSKAYVWTSDGSGTYQIAEADGVHRGTKIILHMREDASFLNDAQKIKEVIHRHSNFVSYEILLNNDPVNTVKALWTLPKEKISEEDHVKFFQFVSGSLSRPMYTFQFKIDSPFALSVLCYVPNTPTQQYGSNVVTHGISLYSHKVLIQSKVQFLPDFLRFLQGVVDSPELPLNLSREHFQDSLLLKRLSTLITKRFLKFLLEELKFDPVKYQKNFFANFGNFIKEGICSDVEWKRDLSKLLLMESSAEEEGKQISIDDYVKRMKPDQKDIFYLYSNSRKNALLSPYYESFQRQGIEVLFMYSRLDDFVMSHLLEYDGKKLVSIETSKGDDSHTPDEDLTKLKNWLSETLSEQVSEIQFTTRLENSPAIIVDQQSAAYRRMMKFIEPDRTPQLAKQILELNPNHPLILDLVKLHTSNTKLATEIAQQILDNALLSAGLLDDPRTSVNRLSSLMESALDA